MTDLNQCPICNVPLVANPNGDGDCSQCKRSWYECEVDGEKSLASRPRRVVLTKFPPEEGDDIRDIIKPAPETRPAPPGKTQPQIIADLVAVARAAHTLADNTEDTGAQLIVDRTMFEDLSKALDVLDELPDAPNEVGTGPRKAEYHLLESVQKS